MLLIWHIRSHLERGVHIICRLYETLIKHLAHFIKCRLEVACEFTCSDNLPFIVRQRGPGRLNSYISFCGLTFWGSSEDGNRTYKLVLSQFSNPSDKLPQSLYERIEMVKN